MHPLENTLTDLVIGDRLDEGGAHLFRCHVEIPSYVCSIRRCYTRRSLGGLEGMFRQARTTRLVSD